MKKILLVIVLSIVFYEIVYADVSLRGVYPLTGFSNSWGLGFTVDSIKNDVSEFFLLGGFDYLNMRAKIKNINMVEGEYFSEIEGNSFSLYGGLGYGKRSFQWISYIGGGLLRGDIKGFYVTDEYYYNNRFFERDESPFLIVGTRFVIFSVLEIGVSSYGFTDQTWMGSIYAAIRFNINEGSEWFDERKTEYLAQEKEKRKIENERIALNEKNYEDELFRKKIIDCLGLTFNVTYENANLLLRNAYKVDRTITYKRVRIEGEKTILKDNDGKYYSVYEVTESLTPELTKDVAKSDSKCELVQESVKAINDQVVIVDYADNVKNVLPKNIYETDWVEKKSVKNLFNGVRDETVYDCRGGVSYPNGIDLEKVYIVNGKIRDGIYKANSNEYGISNSYTLENGLIVQAGDRGNCIVFGVDGHSQKVINEQNYYYMDWKDDATGYVKNGTEVYNDGLCKRVWKMGVAISTTCVK